MAPVLNQHENDDRFCSVSSVRLASERLDEGGRKLEINLPACARISSEHLDDGGRPVQLKSGPPFADVEDFIPDFIRDKVCREGSIPLSCIIRGKRSKNEKQILFKYKFCWYERNNSNVSLGVSTPSARPADRKEQLRPGLRGTMEMSLGEAEVEPDDIEEVRRCDGPCNQWRSVKELRMMGRCEHVICPLCLANAPMIENEDGSIGCCNPECFAADLAAICPDPVLRRKYFRTVINKGDTSELKATYESHGRRKFGAVPLAMKQLTTDTSSASETAGSQPTPKEMIEVCLTIIDKDLRNGKGRCCVFREVSSRCTLKRAVQMLTADLEKNILFQGRLFLVEGNKYTEIDLARHGRKNISRFASPNSTLNLTLDFNDRIAV